MATSRYGTGRDVLPAIADTSPEIVARIGEGRRRLETMPAADPVRTLLHGDLLHRNVPVAGDRTTAVLDWQSSFCGGEPYDHARLEFWSGWHPGLAAVLPDFPPPDLRIGKRRWARARSPSAATTCAATPGRWDEVELTRRPN